MDAYVKHFHERALDCCDLVAEDVLVDICLHGMREDYHVHLNIVHLSLFLRLIEAIM